MLNVDNCSAMFRGRPRAQLVLDHLHDLEAEKEPIVDFRSKGEVKFCLKGQLLDF
jgi:hypothetical protein